MLEDRRVFAGDARLLLPNCRLGLEFEWENTGMVARNRSLPPGLPWSQYWEWHEERSLREGGSEFVFAEPLFGRDAHDAIIGLCAYASDNKWRSSIRTGIHVHVDVRDLEVQQLAGMVTIYALFEKAIYRWVGDERENNHFCFPWYKAEGSILQAASIVRSAMKESDGPEELVEAASHYARYAGFNLQSLQKFGSAEWRQLKTTSNAARVIQWVNICLAFKRAALRAPTSDGAIIADVETRGPTAVARDLLGEAFDLLNYPEFDADVLESGVASAEELLREGLTVNLWGMFELPKGSNQGCEKFIKKNKERPIEDPVPDVRLRDNWLDEFIAAPARRAQQVRVEPAVAAGPDRVRVNAPRRLAQIQPDVRGIWADAVIPVPRRP